MAEGANAAQAAYWTETVGPTWAAQQEPLDRQLAPLGRRAMAELDLGPGRRILDVGCGAGETTVELGREGASVLGVDISSTLLDVARRRPRDADRIRFQEADAQTFAFEPGSFDAVFSRFGVMFFADPDAAFANLRRALRPDGRLAFVCWRPMSDGNELMGLPIRAVLERTGIPAPAPPEACAPGPFAFADPERVRGILARAGFTDVAIVRHDEKVGSGDLETTLALALKVGPLGGLLRENPQHRDAALAAIREALAPHVGSDGAIKLAAPVWIVTASP